MTLQLQLSRTTLTVVESDLESDIDSPDSGDSIFDDHDEFEYSDEYPMLMDSTCPSIDSDVSSSYSSSSDSMPFTELLMKMQETEEDIFLSKNGYQYIDKICNTLQGELIKAKVMKSTLRNAFVGSYVAIKKTDKSLYQQHIAMEDNMSFMVSENCVKEAVILKQLTHNSDVVQFVDCFESDSDFYLVLEYINGITLKEFINLSHKLISECELTKEEYYKAVQYILWQLAKTIRWLHGVVQSCHLDICCENLMLQNFEYIESENGYLMFNENISIKLIDFGVSELFEENEDETISYLCCKYGLSLDNEYFVAPQIYNNDIYDGRCADIWSIGMVMWQMIIGKPLYEPENMWDEPECGYLALVNNKLKEYLSNNKLLKYFPDCSFSLLKNLLMFDENKRFDAYEIVQHEWFESYRKSPSQNKCTTQSVNSNDRSFFLNIS